MFRESITKTRVRFSPLDLEQYIHNPMNQVNDEIDADIFTNALNLNQIRVSECMIPRTEIVFTDVNSSMEELQDIFVKSKLSKIIVVDEDIDNILGYIHHQQLFQQGKSVKDMIRDIPFVPETFRVDDLMLRMNKLRITVFTLFFVFVSMTLFAQEREYELTSNPALYAKRGSALQAKMSSINKRKR